MIKQELIIQGIPSVLWGDSSEKLFIAVHGNMSHKADDIIVHLAKKAVESGYQVLSFDLPEHGNRKNEKILCKVENCVKDLSIIMNYAKTQWNNISLFACSMGVYFSLLAYKNEAIKQSLFLSPVVSMEQILNDMMMMFNISEDKLKDEKEITTPDGNTLYWDYYYYVKANPVEVWDSPTAILYGSNDNISEFNLIVAFSECFDCKLEIMKNGEHYFHTVEQLEFFDQWIRNYLAFV